MGLMSRREAHPVSTVSVVCVLASVASLAAAACEPPPAGSEAPPDFGACPVSYFDEGVPVPPVHLAMPDFFAFGAHVPLRPAGVQVDIENAVGTVRFDGGAPMPAFVFHFVDWSDIQRTVFQGLAVANGVWFPFWLYCTDDGTLDQVWVERTDRPGWTSFAVDGACAPTSEVSTATIDLPANTLSRVALTCGFGVTTPADHDTRADLTSSQPGSMAFPGYTSTTVLVFNTYDCRTNCGARNFFELHSITWNRDRNEVGFQIWYLDPLVQGVLTDNTIVLPRVASQNVTFPDATWRLGNP